MRTKDAVGTFQRLLTSLVLGANVFTLMLLWLCVASTYISPSLFPKASLIGLVFPFILVANLAFIFVWLIFKVRYVWVPILGIAAVGSYVLDYFPCTFFAEEDEGDICLLTYNIGHTVEDAEIAELDSFVRSLNPDIVTFQESYRKPSMLECEQAWMDDLGYEMLRSGSRVVFSRFHILGDSIPMDLPTRSSNNVQGCWLECNGDSLLLLNCHLESNKLTVDDKSEYKKMILEHEKGHVKTEGMMLAGKLCEAAEYRGLQTDSLCRMVDGWKGYSTIVCGDMNDTPISYTYQQLSSRLASAYRERGSGLGATMQEWNFPFRIDHLFHTEDWECTRCYIDKAVYASDHYPFVVYLRRKSP